MQSACKSNEENNYCLTIKKLKKYNKRGMRNKASYLMKQELCVVLKIKLEGEGGGVCGVGVSKIVKYMIAIILNVV